MPKKISHFTDSPPSSPPPLENLPTHPPHHQLSPKASKFLSNLRKEYSNLHSYSADTPSSTLHLSTCTQLLQLYHNKPSSSPFTDCADINESIATFLNQDYGDNPYAYPIEPTYAGILSAMIINTHIILTEDNITFLHVIATQLCKLQSPFMVHHYTNTLAFANAIRQINSYRQKNLSNK